MLVDLYMKSRISFEHLFLTIEIFTGLSGLNTIFPQKVIFCFDKYYDFDFMAIQK